MLTSSGKTVGNTSKKEYHLSLKKYQDKICQDLNLTPSDSVWLATTKDSDYDKFKKGDVNRISLCDLIKEEYDKSYKK